MLPEQPIGKIRNPDGSEDLILPGVLDYVGPSRIVHAPRGRTYSWWRVNHVLTLKKDPVLPPEFGMGPFSIDSSAVLGKGEAFVGPQGMTVEDMAAAIKVGDPRVVKIGGIE